MKKFYKKEKGCKHDLQKQCHPEAGPAGRVVPGRCVTLQRTYSLPKANAGLPLRLTPPFSYENRQTLPGAKTSADAPSG